MRRGGRGEAEGRRGEEGEGGGKLLKIREDVQWYTEC